MSYETTSESRAKKLEGIFTDTSDIIEIESHNCIEYFNKLILDDIHLNLRDINCWIAGGAIRDYISNKKITNDIDIYFSNGDDFKRVKDYIKWTGIRSMIPKAPLFENKNCIKCQYFPKISSDLESIVNPLLEMNGIPIDLIKIYSISPETCIANFDFTICAAAVTKDKFYYHKDFHYDINNKSLNPLNPNPETLLQRIQKFSKMGFSLGNEELIFLTKSFIKSDA